MDTKYLYIPGSKANETCIAHLNKLTAKTSHHRLSSSTQNATA